MYEINSSSILMTDNFAECENFYSENDKINYLKQYVSNNRQCGISGILDINYRKKQ